MSGEEANTAADYDKPLPGRKPVRLLSEWLGVGFVLSLLVMFITASEIVVRLDNLIYDATTDIFAQPPSPDVLVIGIDDASIAKVGRWPWPRARHAEAIERLAAAGVRAIGYDVPFPASEGIDPALTAALQRARARNIRVVVPVQFQVPGSEGRSFDEILPQPGARIGQNAVELDGDGMARRINLATDGVRRWPHVGALLAGTAGAAALAELPPFARRGATVPLRQTEERLVGYRGPPGSFRTLSFADLVEGRIPRRALAGKTVLVGTTAPGLGDRFPTTSVGPPGRYMPAVEVQATVTADILQGRRLLRSPPVFNAGMGLIALWLAMLGLLALRPASAAMFGVGLLLLVLMISAALLTATGVWIGPAAALVALALAPPLWAWRRLSVVNRWMMIELATMGRRGLVLPAAKRRIPVDPVTRTTQLLETMIDRVEELRDLADAAIRGLPDATLLVRRDGSIAEANRAAEAFFGADPDLAAVNTAFNAGQPAYGGGLPAFGAAALADDDSPWRGEHTARDGSVRDVRFTPWSDSAGVPQGWIVRFTDITALRRAEAAREEALQLLTHDMRAPQASILALLDRDAPVPAALADKLRNLARRTIALADGYLQLARADAGDYPMTEVDLAAIATEAVDELWPQSKARGIRLVGTGLEAEALMRGNHGLLLRAVVNLLSNAVKFAPQGSDVRISLRADYTDWRLDVSDDGMGVPAAVQERLFERFRAGQEAGGVGLGLAFVRSVAEGHGGRATCASVPGNGATFTLWLPGQQAQMAL